MSNFGGLSSAAPEPLDGNDLKSFLTQVESSFVQMVLVHSVILKPFTQRVPEVLAVAELQSYPRIGLILAAAKNLDNSFLFADRSAITDLRLLRERVAFFMFSNQSPFSEGITRIAAALTASVLIRQIPINKDVSNIDLGTVIEKNAIADLDRIIQLYKGTTSDIPIDVTDGAGGKNTDYTAVAGTLGKARPSSKLQRVYDKLDLIEEAQKRGLPPGGAVWPY